MKLVMLFNKTIQLVMSVAGRGKEKWEEECN